MQLELSMQARGVITAALSPHRANGNDNAGDVLEEFMVARERAAAQPDGWIKLAEEKPDSDEHDRVLIYTEGHDFHGQQFFDVTPDELHPDSYEHADDMPEHCLLATHWMPRPFPKG